MSSDEASRASRPFLSGSTTRAGAVLALLLWYAPSGVQEQSGQLDALKRVAQEAYERSEVMQSAHMLTDVFGPRLTGSLGDSLAGEWAMRTLRSWGLSAVHAESFPWGRPSWRNDRFHAQVVSPVAYPVLGMARAWSAGTDSLTWGPVVEAIIRTVEDTLALAGKLEGAIVLVDPPLETDPPFFPMAFRHSEELLDQMAAERRPWHVLRPDEFARARLHHSLQGGTPRELSSSAALDFLARQGVLAILHAAQGSRGNFRVGYGGSRITPEGRPIPEVDISLEHYGRMYRSVVGNTPVQMELDIQNRLSNGPATPVNIIGEIPGTDESAEVVMIGAHLDSWHAGTGATDNAAGVAVVMEAVRVLRATRVPLRRTVRIALWSGEEQGMRGSSGYVRQVLSDSAESSVAAYFNLDWGTGAIRAVSAPLNPEMHPILHTWLALIASATDSSRATHVLSLRYPTDTAPFENAGIRTFGFETDPIDYANTQHASQDVYERLIPGDLRHNAMVVASLAYLASNCEQLPER